jgi:predicted Zn-dependent protease
MNRAHEISKEILLIPLGKVLVDVLEEIAVALRKVYQVHVRIGRSEEPETAAYSDERRQFNAEKLLPVAAGRKRENLLAVLGIVDADMFAGEKTFVFGVHTVERASAVLALARLREEFYKKNPKRELFLRRAVTEAIFQIGQALGVECNQKKCVLQATTSLWRLDEKNQVFCPECQTKIEERIFKVHTREKNTKVVKTDEDMAGQGPEGEKILMPNQEKVRPVLEDETEVSGQIVEPEGPLPAELAAIHPENNGPEEPLIADGSSKYS